jgi:hypothetical protein
LSRSGSRISGRPMVINVTESSDNPESGPIEPAANVETPTANPGNKVAPTRGLFLVGGVIKQSITTTDAHVVREHLSSLLQVKNLVILLGSGASFHLGSPQTRNLSNQKVLELITSAGRAASGTDAELLSVINPSDNGDLEQLLNGLQLATSLARQAGQDSVALGTGGDAKTYPNEQVESLRRSINRALADACRLPAETAALEPPFDSDPLRAHRTFLSRIVP